MNIFKSPLPDVEIPVACIGDVVFANVDEAPDAIAMIDGPSGRTFTRAELRNAIARLAGGLVADGIKPGDVVALMGANSPEYAIAFHAIARAGGNYHKANDAIAKKLAEESPHRLVELFRDNADSTFAPPLLSHGRAPSARARRASPQQPNSQRRNLPPRGQHRSHPARRQQPSRRRSLRLVPRRPIAARHRAARAPQTTRRRRLEVHAGPTESADP